MFLGNVGSACGMEAYTKHSSVCSKEPDVIELLTAGVTDNETWVHHYEPESKRQSVEYHYKGPAAKNFKPRLGQEKS